MIRFSLILAGMFTVIFSGCVRDDGSPNSEVAAAKALEENERARRLEAEHRAQNEQGLRIEAEQRASNAVTTKWVSVVIIAFCAMVVGVAMSKKVVNDFVAQKEGD